MTSAPFNRAGRCSFLDVDDSGKEIECGQDIVGEGLRTLVSVPDDGRTREVVGCCRKHGGIETAKIIALERIEELSRRD